MPKGISTKGGKEAVSAGDNECEGQGEEDRAGRETGSPEPDTSCRSRTAANSQTSDTEVVLTCVSRKGCNPRNLTTKRCK